MKDRENIITLMDEEENEVEFEVIATLDVEEQDYAILLPLNEEEEDAYIFRIDMEENEEVLVPVENDEEFKMVKDAYESIMEDQ